MKMLVMCLNMIKRVVCNELKVPVNQYIMFKTKAKHVPCERNLYFESL